jgi:hypothetical protein
MTENVGLAVPGKQPIRSTSTIPAGIRCFDSFPPPSFINQCIEACVLIRLYGNGGWKTCDTETKIM